MRLFFRFVLPLLVLLALMAAIITPLVDVFVGQWFQSDLRIRARLVFRSLEESLPLQIETTSRRGIQILFDRLAEDERVLAVGLCNTSGQLETKSKAWPALVGCQQANVSAPVFKTIALNGGSVLYAAFPLNAEARDLGQFIILHDLSFIERRSIAARFYVWLLLATFAAGAAALTIAIARITLRGWAASVRSELLALDGKRQSSHDPQIAPVISELRQKLRDLDISRRTAAGIRVDWTPDTLRKVLDSELPGVDILVVSNREPYIHVLNEDNSIGLQRPASGLVTAFEPVIRACGGTWIAHGSGSGDRETVDAYDRIMVPPESPAYTLRRVWLSDEEQNGYYFGLANEGLWPLCHITFSRPVFRQADWEHYVNVNDKFASAVAAEAKGPDPIILVQDYHFALLPRMLRQRLPGATIITFWHIPWPNPEVFGVCPWREAIIDGLLGSSVIGFHTQLHCNNFMETADRVMECHTDREDALISMAGHTTQIRPYPISIAWPPLAMAGQASVHDCRAKIFRQYSLPESAVLGVGVERFDFTKGIPDRLRAIEIFLELYPEWVGRFVFLQIAAPTRSKLALYQQVELESRQLVERINQRFGRIGYSPVLLVAQHHEPEQVYEIFRAADLCIVSSLHDGMNLVAKEFVAARDDERGVLILSSFAGASRELVEALIVNPFDARSTAATIERALKMSAEEQQDRMRLMRELVRENNVFYWAGRMLLDAARLRKHRRIETDLASVDRRRLL